MKKFYFCKLCFIVFGALLAVQSAHASQGQIDAVGWGAIVLMALFAVFGLMYQNQKLNNPNDSSLVYLDEIIDIAKLESADAYDVYFYRQSGNEYKTPETWRISGKEEDPSLTINRAALEHLVKTLRKAKWDAAWVMVNEIDHLKLMRNFANQRKNEGKRLGSVEVIAVVDNNADQNL